MDGSGAGSADTSGEDCRLAVLEVPGRRAKLPGHTGANIRIALARSRICWKCLTTRVMTRTYMPLPIDEILCYETISPSRLTRA